MAQLALGTVGAAVGFALGGPTGAAIGFQLGVQAGAFLFAPNITVSGPRLNDLGIGGASYGSSIMIPYGQIRAPGNIIWGREIQEVAHENTVSGGKGGGGSQTQITYTYEVDLAVAFGKGPIDDILRIWADGKIIYDKTSSSSLNRRLANTKQFELLSFYKGTETQLPSSRIESFEGAGNVPAFRGLVYVVFTKLQLADFGNRIPIFTCEYIRDMSDGGSAVTESLETSVADFDMGVSGDYNAGGGEIWRSASNGIIKTNNEVKFWRTNRSTTPFGALDSNQAVLYEYTEVSGRATVNKPKLIIFPLSWDFSSTYSISQEQLTTYSPEGRVWLAGEWLADNTTVFMVDFTRNLYNRTYAVSSSLVGFAWTSIVPIAYIGDYMYLHVIGSGTGAIARVHIGDGSATLLTTLSGTGANNTFRYGGDLSHFLHWDQSSNDLDVYINGEDTPDETINIPFINVVDTAYKEIIHKNGGDYYLLSDNMYRFEAEASAVSNLGSIGNPTVGHQRHFDGGGVVRGTTSTGNKSVWYSLNIAIASAGALSNVVSDICEIASLASTEYDVTNLSGSVEGFLITRQMRARDALEPLLQVAHAGAYESDFKMFFKNITGTSIRTITDNDLSAHYENGSLPAKLKSERQDELSLPRKVEIKYVDKARDHDIGVQEYNRLITNTVNVEQVETTQVLNASEAKNFAEKEMLRKWVGRHNHELFLSTKNIDLNPLDTITVTADNTNYEVLISDVDIGAGIVRIRGIDSDQSAYVANASSVAGEGFIGGFNSLSRGPTVLKILDIKTLRPLDLEPGFYIAVSGTTTAWSGAVVYRSNNNGETYEFLTSFSDGTVIGTATNALADVDDPYVWDRANSLTVYVFDGTLSSASDDLDVLNGANVALLGNEIIQFRDVTDNGDNTYTLTNLLRARRGTETHTGTHKAGEDFVLIQTQGMTRIPLSANDLSVARLLNATSIGETFDSDATETFTPALESSKPLSGVHPSGERDGGGNLTVTWIRRARGNTGWVDYIDSPVDEDSKSFEADVIDVDGSTVLRTIATVSSQFVYTAANSNTDFGSVQATVEFNIFQLSSDIGRGDVLNTTL